ncbi:MAG: hypothetical protein Q8T03_02765 [Bacteroidota bacterium]|nr:hypothetical protein [Bacteroidota bacterium]
MKNLIKITLVFILCTSFKHVSDKVYVCDSSTSVAYHDTKDCRGLNKCTHGIIYITKSSAINTYGKRACKICY